MAECRKSQKACNSEKDVDTICEYSHAIGNYLENTRTLVWMCIENRKLKVAATHETRTLELLKQQVSTACECKRLAWFFSQSKTVTDSMHKEYQSMIVHLIECEQEIQQILTAYN